MANILYEVQQYVVDKLNANPALSACPFLAENKKNIDFEIKNALSRQGIVGLVLTPKATFAGAYMDVGLAWQLDELEVDIVENVQVNRGKQADQCITGQDAAMVVFNTLCPLSGDNEGEFSPVSYEQGEDGSLLVNKCVLKCLVHKTLIPAKTIVQFADGTSSTYDIKGPIELDWLGTGVYPGDVVDVQIGEEVTGLGERSFTGFSQLTSIVVPKNVTSISGEAFSWTGLRDVQIENGLTELGYGVFAYSNSLSSVALPSTLQKIGADVFEECGSLSSVAVPKSAVDMSRVAFRYSKLSAVTMEERTKAEAKAVDNYPWGLENGSVVHCTDGDIIVGQTAEQYTYAVLDGELLSALYEGALTEAMFHAFAPSSYTRITDVSVGTAVTSLSSYAFNGGADLSSAVLPSTVQDIGEGAFFMNRALVDVQMQEGVSSIGSRCFYDCKALKTLDVPSSVVSIGYNAFATNSSPYSQGLDSVLFRGKTIEQVSAMENYPWGIRNTDAISAELPTQMTKFTFYDDAWEVFSAESYLIEGELNKQWFIDNGYCSQNYAWIKRPVEVQLGPAVTAVGEQAFRNCPLSAVIVPSSVSSIGISAFAGTSSLSSALFLGKTAAEVKEMQCYPWGITNTSVISAEL